MNYIIVDVEWCERQHADILYRSHQLVQLAAISMNKEYKELEKWSMIINPGNMDELDMAADAVKNIPKSKLKAGRPYDEALHFFSNWVAKTSTLVVWDEDTYMILKNAFLEAKVNVPFVNVILMQKLCDSLYNKVDFQKVCDIFDITRKESRFHVAREEAKCMKEIFAGILTAHGINSSYMKKNISLASHPFYTRQKQISTAMIHELCRKYKFEYQYVSQTLFVKTKFSYWYIETDGKKIRSVYHENNNLGLKNQRSFKQSFHAQNRQFGSVAECLKYIYYHDQYKMERDVKRHYSSGIEKLFTQIKEE